MPEIRSVQLGRILAKRARKSPVLIIGFGGIALFIWFMAHKGEPHLKISVEKLNIEMSGSPATK